MGKLTTTAKGQVTLRKHLLRHLGVQPGEQGTVDELPDGRIEVRAANRTASFADIGGILRKEGQPALSIEEINEVIAKGWAVEL